jgi:hypothetical protein
MTSIGRYCIGAAELRSSLKERRRPGRSSVVEDYGVLASERAVLAFAAQDVGARKKLCLPAAPDIVREAFREGRYGGWAYHACRATRVSDSDR